MCQPVEDGSYKASLYIYNSVALSVCLRLSGPAVRSRVGWGVGGRVG